MAQFAAGLDVGAHSVKVVIGRVRMRSIEVIERLEVLIPRDADGRSPDDGVSIALSDIAARIKNRPGIVFSALPADAVLIRTASVPRAAARKSDAVIVGQIEDDLPLALDEAVVDHIIREVPGETMVSAIVAVAPRETVASYLALLDRARFDPAELGVGAAVYTDLGRVMPALVSPQPVLVLDMGCARTEMIVIEAGQAVSMRSVSIGGADLTKALVTHHRTSFEQAEIYKCASSYAAMAPVIGGTMDRLVQQIRQTLTGHVSRTGKRISTVLTCGGTSLMPGLDDALGAALGVAVAPLEKQNPMAAGPQSSDGPFLRAAALAHRVLPVSMHERLDLRKGPFAFKGQARATRRRWVRAVVALLVVIAGFSFYSMAQISSLRARQETQRERLAVLSSRFLGEEITDFDVAQKLMQSAKPVKSPMPKADAFDLVREMSVIIPEEIIHDVEELDIKPGKVQIRGIVDTIAARDEIIARLQEYEECVVAISKGKTTQSPKDNRQKYTLDLETECP